MFLVFFVGFYSSRSGTMSLFAEDVPNLRLPNGETVPTSSLDGKKVLLYFSAHWCPPCRRFTPALATAYPLLKEAHPDAEVLFVSADNELEEYEEYHGAMPWPALPYAVSSGGVQWAPQLAADISAATEGIPCLLVVSADRSELLCSEGVEAFSKDKTFANFPWAKEAPKNIPEKKAALTAYFKNVAELAKHAEVTDEEMKDVFKLAMLGDAGMGAAMGAAMGGMGKMMGNMMGGGMPAGGGGRGGPGGAQCQQQ